MKANNDINPVILRALKEDFQRYALLAGVIRAEKREPDFVIGDDYLRRWYLARIESNHKPEQGVLPDCCERTDDFNMYLHCVKQSDDDRAMHDHPWANASLILSGSYIEHTPIGKFERKAGDIVFREADSLHRLELNSDECWSMFVTSEKIREWGFLCAGGWIHWSDFVHQNGCGEFA